MNIIMYTLSENIEKLTSLWFILNRLPPYILDLISYYLSLSMANDFAFAKFASREACKNRLTLFFVNMDRGSYESGKNTNKTVHISL